MDLMGISLAWAWVYHFERGEPSEPGGSSGMSVVETK